MRRGRFGFWASALLAAAVFAGACAPAWDAWPIAARARALTIEVIAPDADTDENEGIVANASTGGAKERPRVLIYHTHTWEAYEMTDDTSYTPTETWRTMDEDYNMVCVGEKLAKELTARGFEVVHDKTAFEPPNLSSAYTRSLAMLEERLGDGERYDYIFDVHRDAYSGLYNGANGVEHGGEQLAYVMLLVGQGTGTTGSGFDERPDWPKNLALAEQITGRLNTLVPGISREVKIKTGRFNQHVSTGALLIEIGNNRNTLDEALAACPVIAQSIADVYEENSRSN